MHIRHSMHTSHPRHTSAPSTPDTPGTPGTHCTSTTPGTAGTHCTTSTPGDHALKATAHRHCYCFLLYFDIIGWEPRLRNESTVSNVLFVVSKDSASHMQGKRVLAKHVFSTTRGLLRGLLHVRQFSPNCSCTHLLVKGCVPVVAFVGECRHSWMGAGTCLATMMRGCSGGRPMSGQTASKSAYIVGSFLANHSSRMDRPRALLLSMSAFISHIS